MLAAEGGVIGDTTWLQDLGHEGFFEWFVIN